MPTPFPTPASSPIPCVIHWHRRDLRISDNLALLHASSFKLPVIPIFFTSSWNKSHPWTGAYRQKFLCESLASLQQNLQSIHGRLIIRNSHPVAGLSQIFKECTPVALCYNRSPDPFGKQTEAEVESLCRTLSIPCFAFDDVALHPPNEILTQSQQPYKVYTPYSKHWLLRDKNQPVGKPKNLQTPDTIASAPLPSLNHWKLPTPQGHSLVGSEREAHKRLQHALSSIVPKYHDTRDLPALSGTSRLSQDLRHGLLSIRTVYTATLKAKAAAPPASHSQFDVFIKELIWREFYFAILHHFPHVLHDSFNPAWQGLPWDEPGDHFNLWKSGKTGFPIVDAGMRELQATGHMHNRVRMITAMFLTKDLHIDWKLGESHFMQFLIDGEIASNNGGWQWSAGTGADAAPYFRIQNPWSQTAKYDPNGHYIRRWIPELQHTPAQKFISPPVDGRPIAPDYPLPCVDHQKERQRTLDRFARHKAQFR